MLILRRPKIDRFTQKLSWDVRHRGLRNLLVAMKSDAPCFLLRPNVPLYKEYVVMLTGSIACCDIGSFLCKCAS